MYNIYSLHALKFAHLWHKGLLPDVFPNTFQYASEVHSYNTRYATPQKIIKATCKDKHCEANDFI